MSPAVYRLFALFLATAGLGVAIFADRKGKKQNKNQEPKKTAPLPDKKKLENPDKKENIPDDLPDNKPDDSAE